MWDLQKKLNFLPRIVSKLFSSAAVEVESGTSVCDHSPFGQTSILEIGNPSYGIVIFKNTSRRVRVYFFLMFSITKNPNALHGKHFKGRFE